ncbi:MAG TPA: MerR family transcriptional regulator [Sandaracinaceae bacterium LLY-WYZ-13_1]|nr:MerR family transcriptional regulator [Sandaracinaceae bacterium LLY-WYZ-13_1]
MPEEPESYTIDELASLTRVPSRTIRFYQSKGALQPPEIRGRVAHYGPAHVERLKLIGELQDRGLRIKAIRELVERIDAGELALGEWLGLQDQLASAWADDHAEVLSQRDLEARLEDRPPGFLADLLRADVIQRQGDAYLVKSPGLFRVTLQLHAAGIDLDVATKAGEILRKHVAKMTRELAAHFLKNAGDGFGREGTTEDLQRAFEVLRPVGLEALRLVFGQEMQRVLREHVESGRTAVVATSRGRPKKPDDEAEGG